VPAADGHQLDSALCGHRVHQQPGLRGEYQEAESAAGQGVGETEFAEIWGEPGAGRVS